MGTMRYVFPLLALVLQSLVQTQDIYTVSQGRGNDDYYADLRSKLSPNASLILPGDALLQEASLRYQAYDRPTYSAVVEVAVENDVVVTVGFANNHSIPFLAVDGAHGLITTLGRMKSGIAISFVKMKNIKINDDGISAQFDPGLTNGDVLRGLWGIGKHAVTAKCLCTGLSGIMLGGGHGLLQGIYGLLADQILEARVVLGDGSLVVASRTSHPDLFWALKGAGHNFGILTSIKYKVYENGPDFNWTHTNMVFTQDKLEKYFEAANLVTQPSNHPGKFVLWTSFNPMPSVDPDNAVIDVYFMLQGDASELETYTAPFRALGPLIDNTTTVPYPDLYALNGDLETSPAVCQAGWYRGLFPVRLKTFNIEAQRKVYNIFNDLMGKYPDVASRSAFLMEGYGTQAVTAVRDQSTAFPFRDDLLLVSPVMGWTDYSLSDEIITVSKQIREILVETTESKKLEAYVNYAWGDESLQALYGYEPWRLEKLLQLKKKYDPRGQFSFYAPIVAYN